MNKKNDEKIDLNKIPREGDLKIKMKSQRNWDCLIRFWSRAGRAFLPRRPDESAAL